MTPNLSMLPLLAVALIIWAGVWAFTWALDRRVRALERRFDELNATDARFESANVTGELR